MAWNERYVDAAAGGGGDGSSGSPWTLAEALAGYAAGDRVNVKAGVYANTTTSRSFATSGTATAPVWWRGYKTTIGDMDDDGVSHGTLASGSEVPAFTFTTGQMQINAGGIRFSNIDIQGAQTSNGQIRTSNVVGKIFLHRCRVECTSANANGRAVSLISTDCVFTNCLFKSTSSAQVVDVAADRQHFVGCVFEGGTFGANVAGLRATFSFCIFRDNGSDAVRASSNVNGLLFLNCTFYSPAGDGIGFTVAPQLAVVANCIFSECGGYGMNNSSGTDTLNVARVGNLFHANTSGNENGFGDTPSHDELADASTPFEDAANGDFTPKSTSNAIGGGIPGTFEGL